MKIVPIDTKGEGNQGRSLGSESFQWDVLRDITRMSDIGATGIQGLANPLRINGLARESEFLRRRISRMRSIQML